MPTPLTVYLTNTADTLITTANQLSTTAPSSETSTATKIGTSTGWVELFAQGTTVNNVGASAPNPDGNGFIWDVTTLQGNQIDSGTLTATLSFSVSVGSIKALISFRLFKRSANGSYTQISSVSAAASQTLTTTTSVINFNGSIASPVQFYSGDKLYADVLFDISLNNTGSSTASANLFMNGGANEEIVTPGYDPNPLTFRPFWLNNTPFIHGGAFTAW